MGRGNHGAEWDFFRGVITKGIGQSEDMIVMKGGKLLKGKREKLERYCVLLIWTHTRCLEIL